MRRPKLRGVYAIACHGRFYIGCAEDVAARWRAHLRDLSAGTHACPELQQAWASFGRAAFSWEVLQLVPKPEPLIPYENLWMRARAGQLYNAMPENHHGIGSRYALSEAQLAAWVKRYAEGRVGWSQEMREQISRATSAWTRRPGVRSRMSKIALESNAARFIRTPEAVAHNAEAQRGVSKSAAQRANMSRAHSQGTCRCHPRKEQP